MQELNIARQKKLIDAININDMDVLDNIFAPDVINHDPAPDQDPGLDGIKNFFQGMRAAFPDMKFDLYEIVAEVDDVATAYTVTGTHRGIFKGIAGTGRKVTAKGMQICRYEDGKITERWGSSVEHEILEQLKH